MKKEAKTNLQIFILLVIVLVLLVGVVRAITISFNSPPQNNLRISSANGTSMLLNVSIIQGNDHYNITNVTFYYNGSAGMVFINTTNAFNATSFQINWTFGQLNGTFFIKSF